MKYSNKLAVEDRYPQDSRPAPSLTHGSGFRRTADCEFKVRCHLASMNSRRHIAFPIHRTAKLFHCIAFLFLILGKTSLAQVPQIQHVFIVLEENTNYADVCGPNNTSLPFLCSLKNQGSFSSNYYAPTHPSIGNYNDLGWGVVTTNDDSCVPTTCGFPYSGDNIVREIEAVGKTWKGYAESLPNTCYFEGDTGQYAVRHSPIPYIADVQTNCLDRYVAFEDPNLGFAKDLANNSLPAYGFITPNLCDDAHDCGLPGSPIPDQWLQTNVIQPLLNAGHLDSMTGDTVLIVTFDESRSDNTNGGGLVYWFMMGKGVKQNYQSTGPSAFPGFYSHESTLKAIAEMLGARFSGLGSAADAPDMTEFFETFSGSLSPTSLAFGNQAVGSTSQPQIVTLSNTGSAALSITSIAAAGDFAETNNCGNSLAASGNCAINVTFKPTASGTRTGNLNTIDNAMGSPQMVSLTGIGSSAAPDFSLSVSPLSTTITAGQSATFSLTVIPSGGFNQKVSLSCAGLPQGVACMISPTDLTPNGSTASNASILLSTTVRGMVPVVQRPRGVSPQPVDEIELAKILGIGAPTLLASVIVNRRRRQLRLPLGIAMLVIGLAGCNKAAESTTSNVGTPAGTYTLTLIGTTDATALSHSTTATLNVE